MAITSDGAIIVNTHQLTNKNSLAAAVEAATKSGLGVFVGVVVPNRLRKSVFLDIDDALSDVVGRLGPRLLK
jgi:hypothetical protein